MTEEKCDIIKRNKCKFEPPDGGWGYMIWICMIITYSVGQSFLPSFGLIFKEFIDGFHVGTTQVTILNGINLMSVAIGGFLTAPMLNVLSKRKVALLGAILYNLGCLLQIFVNSMTLLSFAQGLQRFAYGILYTVASALLNEYFKLKKFLTLSVVYSVAASLTMATPILMKWCLETYGLRGTLIIISGISMHLFVAVSVIQPVKWHLKKIPLEEKKEETKLLIEQNVKGLAEGTESANNITNMESNNISKKDVENEKNVAEEQNPVKKLIQSFIAMVNMKSYFMSCACLGMVLSLVAESTYVVMLPQALYASGWSQKNVSFTLSLLSFGDLLTRVLFIFIHKWLRRLGSHKIFIVGLLISFVTKLGVQSTENVTLIMTYIAIMGSSRCSMIVLIPLVVADAVAAENFAAAMGLFMFTYGLMGLSFGVVIGAVRDLTNSYPTVYYILTSCYAIVALFWCIEICYKENSSKRKQTKLKDKNGK